MSGSAGATLPKHKLCPTCRHIYPAASNFCPQDQAALVVSDDVIAGRYILVRMVGAGAMGKVYMAEDTQLGRRVALKLLNPSQDAQLRIDREAKAVGALDHDNVVRVYERGQHDDGRVYIAMEFLEGESLRQHLGTHGKLPIRQALDLWLQAVRGVAAAHKKGVVHRDLKPDNLFLARREQDDGTIEQLKVLDFGIAQLRSDRPVRGTMRIGTPGYVAPEQWMRGEATARSDVYSLGVILLEMLTGRRSPAANPQAPLEALERFALSQPLSPALIQLAGEVLAVAPEQRPENARILLDRLRLLPESRLWSTAAVAAPRESQAPPIPPSSDALLPLSAEDEEADTEQVGIESLRLAPRPSPSPPEAGRGLKALDQVTVRVDRLPGLLVPPTPESSPAGAPDRARVKALDRPPAPAPQPGPPPLPAAIAAAELLPGPVAEPVSGLIEDERTAKQPVGTPDRLPLPVQSTLLLLNPTDLLTLNFPALAPLEPAETRISLPDSAKRSPDPRIAGAATTMVSGRSHAATVTSGIAPTLPAGLSKKPWSPTQTPAQRLRAFLRSPTAVGPVGQVLMLCALLGLLASGVLIWILRLPN